MSGQPTSKQGDAGLAGAYTSGLATAVGAPAPGRRSTGERISAASHQRGMVRAPQSVGCGRRGHDPRQAGPRVARRLGGLRRRSACRRTATTRARRRSARRSSTPGTARATPGVDPSGRQPAPSVVELEGARELWDEHPLSERAPLDRPLHGRGRGRGRPPARDQRRRRDAAAHPRRHAPAQPRRRRDELRRGRAVERGGRRNERDRHRGGRRARRPGVRRRALHRAGPALDLRGGAGDRPGDRRAARDHRPDRRHQRASTRTACRSWWPPRAPSRRCCAASCTSATMHLRARYGRCSGPESAGAALVTGTAACCWIPSQRWRQVTFPAIPAGGGSWCCPPGLGRSPSRSRTTTSTSCVPRRSAGRAPARPLLELARARRRGARGSPRRRSTLHLRPPPRRAAHPDDPAPWPAQRREPVRRALRRDGPSGQRPGRDVAAAQAPARRRGARRLPPGLRGRQRRQAGAGAARPRCRRRRGGGLSRAAAARIPPPPGSCARARSWTAGCASR